MTATAATEQICAQARVHHGAGRLDEAENLYRRILDAAPADIEARHMMGVVRLQQGRAAEAQRDLEPCCPKPPAMPISAPIMDWRSNCWGEAIKRWRISIARWS